METGKPTLSSVPVHTGSVRAQAEKRMDIQAPLTAVYIQTVPAVPMQPFPQPPADARETNALHLAMPPLYSKETLPFLTLHLAGGLQPQLGLSAAAAAAPAPAPAPVPTPTPAAKPKSAGKHVCPHCGRDCMKPSVLEKHLRCHTGERPYPCTTCGVSFKTQSNLYKHRRTQAHARQSSESEQSNLGSLDSMSSSRETCSSSLSLDEQCEDLGSEEKHATLSATESPTPAVRTQSSEQRETSPTVPRAETNGSDKLTVSGDKQKAENTKESLTISRHLQLQRQEATLFSKQWERSVSRGKSQSHESTDSGFSESSDHYPSPSSVLPEHCVDSLSKPSREHLEETQNTHLCSEQGHGGRDEKDAAREQVHKRLEERISKLISDNSAVVEDKHLENVRPRKTVLSKQGSIDLPMPYTYKDSFHFDIKINPAQNTGMQRHTKSGLFNSVPTQCSSTTEHAPLTRSSSLPFSVTLLQPDRSSSTSSSQSDYATDIGRGNSGQINPTGLLKKPVNQHSSSHRPLVRQTAVDCNHTTDSLLTTSSVEEACTGSLSCDRDASDIIGEPGSRKFRRKKAQKFAYNKWYMYGGGTFKKLYDSDKSGDSTALKGRKCLTNLVHEAAQGVQKRVSMLQKETVTRSGSTVNFSTSSATAGHLSANLSLVSSVDLNVERRRLHSTNGSAKAPLTRHLSLSVLPSSATRSVPVHKTECFNRTEVGRLGDVPKHSDSTTELCEAHVPSDRKKQKTDEKIISPLEMEIAPNTLTQHPVSVTVSTPTQGTDLTYVQAKEIPNSPGLKGTLFLPCLLNANVSQISTSATTSVSVASKSSFLPKYQLKLPNAHEPGPVSLPQAQSKPKGTDDCSPSPSDQTLVTSYENISKNTLPSMQTQDHLAFSRTVTSMCQVKTSQHTHSLSSNVSVMQRQLAATTITTSCFQDYSSGLCSALLHCSKTATDSMHKHLPRPLATAAPSVSLPTGNNQTSAATITGLSHHLSNHSSNPLGDRQLSTASILANPTNKANVDSNASVVRCRIVPLDQQAQNVFHVHTADLQICLQIISDEQMALIAPQIERQSGPSLSQLREIEVVTPEGALSKSQTFDSMKMSNATEVEQQPKDLKEGVRQEHLSRLNSERATPPQSLQLVKEKTEHSDAYRAASSTKSFPPQPPSRHLHNSGHLITVTQTRNSVGSIMATSASVRGENSGGSHTSEAKQVLFPNTCAEEKFLSTKRVNQIGMASQMLTGQQKICERSFSTSPANQSSMKIEPLDKSQQKAKHPGASCNANVLNSQGGALACKISRTESGEFLKQANSDAGIDASVSQLSNSNPNVVRQLNPQAFVFHSHHMEPAKSTSQSSLKHANVHLSRVELSDNSSSSMEYCPQEIQNVMRRDHSEKSPGQFNLQPASVDMKRPGDVTSFQSSTTGITDGAQADLDSQEHGETPVQLDSTDRRPKQNQGEPERKQQRLGEQGNDGLTKSDKGPESDSRHVAVADMSRREGEETNLHMDTSKISCLSEQHFESLSQKNSCVSECPQPNLRQAPNTSHNSDTPANSIHSSLLNSPPLEINHLYSPQKTWDRGIVFYNQQMQVSCESNLSQDAPIPISTSETQSVFLCAEPSLQSFSSQDQTKGAIGFSAQQGCIATSNYSCDVFTVESKNNSCVLPDFRTLSSTYFSQVQKECRGTGETTEDIQMLPDNQITESPSQPFLLLEPEKKQDAMDSLNDFISQSSNAGRPDITSKYQSVFMIGSFHGYQSSDCLPSGVRPVPSFQDNTEDTSSSDDEGKLIIEL
ncbi:zinc finger protein 831 [Xiphophorus hellerii]|uniref:zinc finger protein 831 n=1 Tax=Xiphophorus hellerii TaxID=8084 RepID=UPI0013B3990B|nr:serine-rich adhesin for platelets-like [Xiphophorus hellerii]XP_032404424.1 serine-rich adhesin for platelets-like [Xiphophorus hellerii]